MAKREYIDDEAQKIFDAECAGIKRALNKTDFDEETKERYANVLIDCKRQCAEINTIARQVNALLDENDVLKEKYGSGRYSAAQNEEFKRKYNANRSKIYRLKEKREAKIEQLSKIEPLVGEIDTKIDTRIEELQNNKKRRK